MNRLCKLCDGEYDFSSLEITKCLNEISIGFAGGSRKADNDSRFKFCPACGEKLTKENFGRKGECNNG